MRYLAMLCVSLALAACGEATVWVRPGATQADAALQDHHCWVEAKMLNPDRPKDTLGLGAGIDRAFDARSCMVAHGYSEVSAKTASSPPTATAPPPSVPRGPPVGSALQRYTELVPGKSTARDAVALLGQPHTTTDFGTLKLLQWIDQRDAHFYHVGISFGADGHMLRVQQVTSQ